MNIMSKMKILLPYRDSCDREITSSVVSGGGEQFCKLINKNFINVEVLKVPSKAEQSWSVKEKYDLQKKIVETAEDVNADIIISNFPSSIYNGKYITQSKIPVMIVMHNRFKMGSIFSRLKFVSLLFESIKIRINKKTELQFITLLCDRLIADDIFYYNLFIKLINKLSK